VYRSIMLAAALAVATPAFTSAQTSTVTVQDAWARATPPHASTAVVYMTLTSPKPDKLIAASTPVAATAQLHLMEMDGNVMKMRSVPGGLDLPAGKPVTLGPSGYHIMLEGLKQPLKQGQTVTLRLTFQTAAPVDVVADVQPIGAPAPSAKPGAAAMSGTSMPGMAMGK
jgi:copper(I)-binding protein